jgi:hypothetical protein
MIHDLTGQRFGMWRVAFYSGRGKWECRCDCGEYGSVRAQHLLTGQSKSCGCGPRLLARRPSIPKSSGLRRSYSTWQHMLRRCNTPSDPSYKYYGARGISVCERWLKFENFLADMGEKPEGLSIERKDSLGNYCPENCIWDTVHNQARNRRSNVYLTHQGITLCMTDWANKLGISVFTLGTRIRKGWSVERALSTIKRPAN